MAQVFKTKAAAEKAAHSVNHYLAEQQMYLTVKQSLTSAAATAVIKSCGGMR